MGIWHLVGIGVIVFLFWDYSQGGYLLEDIFHFIGQFFKFILIGLVLAFLYNLIGFWGCVVILIIMFVFAREYFMDALYMVAGGIAANIVIGLLLIIGTIWLVSAFL